MPRDHAFARGMSMRYVAYEQAGARLGVLPDALAGTFTCPRQALSLDHKSRRQPPYV